MKKTNMNFDELLIERKWRRSKWGRIRAMVPCLIFLCIVYTTWWSFDRGYCEPRVALAAAILSYVAAILAVSSFCRRSNRYEAAKEFYLSKVPDSLIIRASDFYGPSEWVFAAIECNESHIPGDCPLCGAE